ncbi:MAG: hypothetical protein LBL91_05830 [Lachnospiraceae bacterium]|jgi:hypothetical protein|nr:hypothetical protein [Lachnospiraceae bacterium]
MKKKKSSIAIIVLLILLVAIGIGYAAFGDILTINGSATANGTFAVIFESVTDSGDNVTAAIDTDKTILNVSATLGFPGDGVSVTPVITNSGTIPAKVKSINVYNNGTEVAFSDADITISVPTLATDTLAVNEDCEFTFTIEWNEDSTLSVQKTVNFDVVIEYEQDTTPFSAEATHDAH